MNICKHHKLGKIGESLAAAILRKNYQLRGSNVRFGHLECDLLAYDNRSHQSIIVEVKTRSMQNPWRNGLDFELFADAIGPAKIKCLQRIRALLTKQGPCRIDSFFVQYDRDGLYQVDHQKNIF